MKTPFSLNPFAPKVPPTLVVVPAAPEAFEARKPMRSLLTPNGAGSGLGDLPGAPRPKRPVVVLPTPAMADAGDTEEPAAPPTRRR